MNGVVVEPIKPIRDYLYEPVCGAPTTPIYPIEWEIPHENTGTLKNQGTVGACVAEVITQIAEYQWNKELNKQEEHSEGFVYGTFRDNYDGWGLIVSDAMKSWKNIGTVPKSYYNKLMEMPEMKEMVAQIPELLPIAQKYRIKGYVSLNYADKQRRDTLIKEALTKHNYGLVGVSNNYFAGGSHCIQITGWNDRKDKYKFKNSWGATYGKQGFSEMPKKYLNDVYLPLFEEVNMNFTDVNENDWFYDYVKQAVFADILNGTSETTFEPNKPLTRAEMSKVVCKLLDKMDEVVAIANKINK